MKNQNILCCLNENPIFAYNPIRNEETTPLQQVIINYITKEYHGKRWFWCEKCNVDNVEFVYCEVNLSRAFQKIENNKKYKKNTIEQFCLSFLNTFLESTPDKLINFLKSTANFKEKDLKEIEAEFNKYHSQIQK